MSRGLVPGLAARLLRAALPRAWRDAVERDMEELFLDRCRRSALRARAWYWGQVLSFFTRFGMERVRNVGARVTGMGPGEGGRGSDWLLDLRHAGRTLAKTPLAVLISVLSLGLGIGVSATVYAVGRAFLFQDPGPVKEPTRLVTIYTSGDRGRPYDETSFPDYQEIAAVGGVFEGVAAMRMGVLTPTADESADRFLVEVVTGNYFEVLGVRPALGRTFTQDETTVGAAEPQLVLSHRAWRERFGSDRGILGRNVELDGRVYTVIGVAPEGLVSRFLQMDLDGWVPIGIPGGTYHSTPRELSERQDRDYFVFARLFPGVALEAAQTRLTGLAGQLAGSYPEAWVDEREQPRAFTVVTEAESRIPPDGRAALTGLAVIALGAAFLILLVACANVAGLLLARAQRRTRELAIRASLGASRGRLLRMLLTESVLLAAVGGLGGVYLARIATRYLGQLPLPVAVPIRFRIALDANVLIFALLLSLAAGLFAGLAPALRGSRPDLLPYLREHAGFRRLRLQRLLVVAQVACATALLVGTGLAVRSLAVGSTFSSGLDVDRVAIAWKEPPPELTESGEIRRWFLDLRERLEADPAVESAALARVAEAYAMTEGTATGLVDIEGGEPRWVPYNAVTPGYMEMFGIQLRRGRTIAARDVEGAPRAAVVNEAFADRFWPGDEALGRSFQVNEWRDHSTPTDQEGQLLVVVGVAADAPSPGGTASPFIWTSFLQDEPARAMIHLRGRSSAEAVVPLLEREIEAGTDDTILITPGPYRDLVDVRFMGNRLATRLFGAAGVFALLLAVMGVYGMVSFAVGRRLREMALRQALGARQNQTVRALVRGGMGLATIGVVVGLGIAVACALAVRSALFGISPVDPIAVGGVGAVLLLAALLASLVPSLRLLSVQPMNVLRED